MKIISSRRKIPTEEPLGISLILTKNPRMRLKKFTTNKPSPRGQMIVKNFMHRIEDILYKSRLHRDAAMFPLRLRDTQTKVPHPLVRKGTDS